jgi:hypothetical protein
MTLGYFHDVTLTKHRTLFSELSKSFQKMSTEIPTRFLREQIPISSSISSTDGSITSPEDLRLTANRVELSTFTGEVPVG